MIKEFQGPHRFLSNFWPASVVLDDIEYSSVELAYVAAKTTNLAHRIAISNMTPGQAKRYGRQIPLREGWDGMKLAVMEDLVRQKFQGELLAKSLLATSPQILIEGNAWGDTFWGMCGGRGENNLGKILMKIRGEIWEAKQ